MHFSLKNGMFVFIKTPFVMYADVLLPLYLARPLTYLVPAPLQDGMRVGSMVSVPLGAGGTLYPGIVTALHDDAPSAGEFKEVAAEAGPQCRLEPSQLAFWRWMADYYCCTEGEVMKAALPSALMPEPPAEGEAPAKRRRRAAKERSLPSLEDIGAVLPVLSAAQQQACDAVREAWDSRKTVLLHGVTSSGKTEIYIHLIHETLLQGKQVLYLLPEIALTAQMIERLKQVFGDRISVYHSRHTDKVRADVWRRFNEDAPGSGCDVVLGVRSSLFLPFKRLGLVIVDEEHENTYKQFEPAPRYHARDAAVMLASLHGGRALLGTATPSFESYHNAQSGKYALVRLTERYGNVSLPRCTLADMSAVNRRSLFHPLLEERMRAALDAGKQVILFQNRRGYSPYLQCDVCGQPVRCRQCDVSMTYHRLTRRLVCHYCGAFRPETTICPACHAPALRMVGYGTERIEAEVQALFPGARTARLDLDSTRSKSSYSGILSAFAAHETDVLIGTQMVAKGLDFDDVALIGVLQADQLMNYPDFRSYERSYQLMEQVSGRAGRRDGEGEVVIQTTDVKNPLLQWVMRHDFEAMYEAQAAERRMFMYPPFCRLMKFSVKHRDAAAADAGAAFLADRLRTLSGCEVLGPQEAMAPMVRRQYIRQIMMKVPKNLSLPEVRRQVRRMTEEAAAVPGCRNLVVLTDVDPM